MQRHKTNITSTMKTFRIICYYLATFSCLTAAKRSWGFAKSVKFETRAEEKNKWSSYLTVNPSKMVTYMINHGGLVLPKSAKDDLQIFSKVCHADEVLLNVLEKKMQIRNFTLHTEGNKKDIVLRIGRMYVEWNSYRKPCLSIEVDDVDMLVEFMNIILTQSNWNKLKESGFPPSLHTDEAQAVPTKGGTTEQESFVRISSIDFSGNITCTLKSRPLKKDVAVIQFDLDALDELDRLIRSRSEENLINTGRRGCTTDEIYKILKQFFGRQLKDLAASNVEDILQGRQMSALEGIKRAWASTSNSASGYVDDAKDYTEEKLQGKLSESLNIGKETIKKFGSHPFIQALQLQSQEEEHETSTE